MKNLFEQEPALPSCEKQDQQKDPRIEKIVAEVLEMAKQKEMPTQRLRVLEYVYAQEVYLKKVIQDNPELLAFSGVILENTEDNFKFWDLPEVRRLLPLMNDSANKVQIEKKTLFAKGLDESYATGGLVGALEFAEDFFRDADTAHILGDAPEESRAGVIYFKEPELKDNGKSVVALHYISVPEQEGRLSYEESLRILAEKLVAQGRYVDYIQRKTWMADMEKSVEYGFQKVSRKNFDSANGLRVWGQFLSKDGQLNAEAVKYFFENGEPKYKETIARMDLADLIARYLPEKRGQEIEFEKTSPQELQEQEQVAEMKKETAKNFNDMDFEQYLTWLRQSKVWESVLESEEGRRLFEQLRIHKNQGLKFADLQNMQELEVASDKIDSFIEQYFKNYEKEKVRVKIPE
ncbi:MAG: hypothetical protein WCF93_05800 [Candidatus Moraniibacteriota bacterium]